MASAVGVDELEAERAGVVNDGLAIAAARSAVVCSEAEAVLTPSSRAMTLVNEGLSVRLDVAVHAGGLT